MGWDGGGVGGWGHRGQKKRQRGGVSKAEGGLWSSLGIEMDGNILFYPSFLLFLTWSNGSTLQQSCVVVGKAARSTKDGLSSKYAVQHVCPLNMCSQGYRVN